MRNIEIPSASLPSRGADGEKKKGVKRGKKHGRKGTRIATVIKKKKPLMGLGNTSQHHSWAAKILDSQSKYLLGTKIDGVVEEQRGNACLLYDC